MEDADCLCVKVLREEKVQILDYTQAVRDEECLFPGCKTEIQMSNDIFFVISLNVQVSNLPKDRTLGSFCNIVFQPW